MSEIEERTRTEFNARFLRWAHCMWWFLRPWRWPTERVHCKIDITGSFIERYRNPSNVPRLIGCSCGRVFFENGPESRYLFNEFMLRTKTRQGKRWGDG